VIAGSKALKLFPVDQHTTADFLEGELFILDEIVDSPDGDPKLEGRITAGVQQASTLHYGLSGGTLTAPVTAPSWTADPTSISVMGAKIPRKDHRSHGLHYTTKLLQMQGIASLC
jgi:hypothetical protein